MEAQRGGFAAPDPAPWHRGCADSSRKLCFRWRRADTERAITYTLKRPECYRWDFFAGPDELAHERRSTRNAFARHYPARGRYVAAALPRLPFADNSFSLAVVSHLLFVFADRLDRAFHLAAIVELVRVTRGEVRVFPLIDPETIRYPALDQLRKELDAAGIASEVRRVDYIVQPGGGELFVCERAA